MSTYDVLSAHPLHPTIAADILPTPRLLSEGTRHPVEAYEEHPASDRYRPVWRVRDDSYDPPGTVYRRVIVRVNP